MGKFRMRNFLLCHQNENPPRRVANHATAGTPPRADEALALNAIQDGDLARLSRRSMCRRCAEFGAADTGEVLRVRD